MASETVECKICKNQIPLKGMQMYTYQDEKRQKTITEWTCFSCFGDIILKSKSREKGITPLLSGQCQARLMDVMRNELKKNGTFEQDWTEWMKKSFANTGRWIEAVKKAKEDKK